MSTRRATSRLVPWLLALVLLAAQALAFAHTLKHDLHQHDDPSCVLHLHTKHVGQASAGNSLSVLVTPADDTSGAASTFIECTAVLGYRTRAPPLSSARSI